MTLEKAWGQDQRHHFAGDHRGGFFFMRDQLGISGSSTSRWVMPILLMVAVQLAAGAVELVVGFMMVPRGQPSTTAQESTEHYRGFGHPSQIFARLPDLAIPLRWEGFLNRVYKGRIKFPLPSWEMWVTSPDF